MQRSSSSLPPDSGHPLGTAPQSIHYAELRTQSEFPALAEPAKRCGADDLAHCKLPTFARRFLCAGGWNPSDFLAAVVACDFSAVDAVAREAAIRWGWGGMPDAGQSWSLVHATVADRLPPRAGKDKGDRSFLWWTFFAITSICKFLEEMSQFAERSKFKNILRCVHPALQHGLLSGQRKGRAWEAACSQLLSVVLSTNRLKGVCIRWRTSDEASVTLVSASPCRGTAH